jgi:hypothetical protein
MNKLSFMAGLVVLGACGGRTYGVGGSLVDGGGTPDAGHAESGEDVLAPDGAIPDDATALHDANMPVTDAPVDTGLITYDGPPSTTGLDAAPAVGSPACEDDGCVFCSDGYYHCQPSGVYPPCPVGISTADSCGAYDVLTYGCFTCGAAGEGYLWLCPSGLWSLVPFGCTP